MIEDGEWCMLRAVVCTISTYTAYTYLFTGICGVQILYNAKLASDVAVERRFHTLAMA